MLRFSIRIITKSTSDKNFDEDDDVGLNADSDSEFNEKKCYDHYGWLYARW